MAGSAGSRGRRRAAGRWLRGGAGAEGRPGAVGCAGLRAGYSRWGGGGPGAEPERHQDAAEQEQHDGDHRGKEHRGGHRTVGRSIRCVARARRARCPSGGHEDQAATEGEHPMSSGWRCRRRRWRRRPGAAASDAADGRVGGLGGQARVEVALRVAVVLAVVVVVHAVDDDDGLAVGDGLGDRRGDLDAAALVGDLAAGGGVEAVDGQARLGAGVAGLGQRDDDVAVGRAALGGVEVPSPSVSSPAVGHSWRASAPKWMCAACGLSAQQAGGGHGDVDRVPLTATIAVPLASTPLRATGLRLAIALPSAAMAVPAPRKAGGGRTQSGGAERLPCAHRDLCVSNAGLTYALG